MKVLGRVSPGEALGERLDALAEAADLAEGRLDAEDVEHARTVVARAGARRALSVAHTAAALAGATGSGKSSLFNALAGEDLSPVGVRRPTTSAARAAVWGAEGGGPLLDWLEVPSRHQAEDGDLAGLILLDLPDHDSIRLDHRLEVDRLVELVDLLVWVMDPQKYADAAVHERYLRPLAPHRDVIVVVLNQVDRLGPDAAGRCLADLRRLLDEDGLAGVPLLATSAKTGEGLPELRDLLAARAAARRTWAARLSADVEVAADRLRGDPPAPSLPRVDGRDLETALVDALSEAAGVPAVAQAVGRAHRHRAVLAAGWPVTRGLRRLRPDPLGRLRLGTPGRTSLPAATSVQRSRVDTAVRDVADAASRLLSRPWAEAVRRAARSNAGTLADALDRVVSATGPKVSRAPLWWRAAGALQWLFLAAAVSGALWLAALAVLGYLRLPEPPTPTVGELPLPTALLGGGILAGLLLALLARAAGALGGARRRRRTARLLRARIQEVAETQILAPVREELDRHERTAALLERAKSP
ncbi:GTPase [Bailinhaonella thermotolerans]|uniref:ABC transporter n=1 Tax=Bailinhaonella thermotolerans TaxID=1070861 RepID=A0A3A4BR26_9ACTN|nr:GTPase [Bailinhaonella thermotolerans]RJL33596.1 ABC transporter [Bailinhaonella thermotolerans]